jgi:hypothetical protein
MLLGFRVYDAEVGRFFSPDPVFQLVNQFAYTLGNPVWYSDRDGADGVQTAVAVGEGGAFVATVVGVIATGGTLTTAGAVAAGIGIGLGGLLFAIAVTYAIGWSRSNNLSGPGPGLDSGGGDFSAMGLDSGADVMINTAEVSGGCAPMTLTRTPGLLALLPILLSLHLFLGLVILRRRRQQLE